MLQHLLIAILIAYIIVVYERNDNYIADVQEFARKRVLLLGPSEQNETQAKHYSFYEYFSSLPDWFVISSFEQYMQFELPVDICYIPNQDLVAQLKPRALQSLKSEYCQFFDDKNQLAEGVTKFDQLTRGSLGVMAQKFLPQSFNLEKENQLKQLQIVAQKNPSQLWIWKKSNAAEGYGIKVVSNLTKFLSNNGKGRKTKNVIVSRYISNPLLHKGRKVDFRHWVFFFQSEEHTLLLFAEGFARFAVLPYSLSQFQKARVHMTHRHWCNETQNGQQNCEDIQITMQELQNDLQIEDDSVPQKMQQLKQEVLKISAYAFLSRLREIKNKKGAFHLFGIDFLVDDQFTPYLLEINYYPDINPYRSSARKKTLPNMLYTTFDLMVSLLDNWEEMDDFLATVTADALGGQYSVLYNSASRECVLDFDKVQKFVGKKIKK